MLFFESAHFIAEGNKKPGRFTKTGLFVYRDDYQSTDQFYLLKSLPLVKPIYSCIQLMAKKHIHRPPPLKALCTPYSLPAGMKLAE
jgi:hypothetical protein